MSIWGSIDATDEYNACEVDYEPGDLDRHLDVATSPFNDCVRVGIYSAEDGGLFTDCMITVEEASKVIDRLERAVEKIIAVKT